MINNANRYDKLTLFSIVQDIQMNNPRIGSPLASVVLDNYPSVSLANNIKSVEGTSILILTK